MSLSQHQLTVSAETVFLATAQSAVTGLYLVNLSLSAVTVTVYLVKDSDSASMVNTVYSDLTIDPAETIVLLTDRVLLDSGDRLQASASADFAVSATCVFALL